MKTSKILSCLTAGILGISMLTSCGDKKDNSSNEKDDGNSVSVSEIKTNDDGSINKELTSTELVTLMGNGINLGNTMEAYGHNSLEADADPQSFETLWGQPVTTQESVEGMKSAGFDSLRIPVAWTNAIDFESGDYTINSAYLDRVEEIVNYALNADLYVIINDHWDGGWWGMFGSATAETQKQAMDLYTSMWTQISNRFKNYSDKLIFESANEELGNRLNDTDIAEDSGTLSQDECYTKTNEINQKFVDTVRGTGGNNEQRFLLIAGYNTDITCTADDRFVMPTDTASSKLLLSVHYYTPWDYCGTDSVSHWGTDKDYAEQNRLFEMMNKFTESGVGVVIGEYSVLTDNSTPKEDTDKFYTNLLDNCDLYNYCPMLWDCNTQYNRTTHTMSDETIAQIFLDRSYQNQSSMTQDEIKQNAKTRIEETAKNAPDKFTDDTAIQVTDDTSVAWIMYQSKDYGVSYSVGDEYDPASKTDGLVAENVQITGEGTYTVSLDFTNCKTAKGVAFSALGIANGETLFPDYIVTIDKILINGSPYDITEKYYTCSDDGACTRVNLFNEWVSSPPDDARTTDGDATDATASILNLGANDIITTLSITFTYSAPK